MDDVDLAALGQAISVLREYLMEGVADMSQEERAARVVEFRDDVLTQMIPADVQHLREVILSVVSRAMDDFPLPVEAGPPNRDQALRLRRTA